MKITKIENQKNYQTSNLEIDNKFFLNIDQTLVMDSDLFVGRNITNQELTQIKNENASRQGLKKAFSLLETRMNSEAELERKLRRKFDFTATKKVLLRLKELGYIDDNLFAKNWVIERGKTRGQRLLRAELRQKGIHTDIIEAVIADRNIDEVVENARQLVIKKNWGDIDIYQKRQRVIVYLARRGYQYNVIDKIIKNME